MSSVRSLLSRIARLEQARVAPRSPVEIAYGSLEVFEQETRAAVDTGALDRRDMYGADGNGGVMRAIRRWHEQGLFGR
jgi:hypothetical protein